MTASGSRLMDAKPKSSHTAACASGCRSRRAAKQNFRWRGKEVSRVEGFTDAVFAFAVTLLVVALEVPHTFEGLMDVVRGFPAFVICFTLLMMFWNAHYRYHRRYGLEERIHARDDHGHPRARVVLRLSTQVPVHAAHRAVVRSRYARTRRTSTARARCRSLYLIYGLGLAGVWGLYAALYGHALAQARATAARRRRDDCSRALRSTRI